MEKGEETEKDGGGLTTDKDAQQGGPAGWGRGRGRRVKASLPLTAHRDSAPRPGALISKKALDGSAKPSPQSDDATKQMQTPQPAQPATQPLTTQQPQPQTQQATKPPSEQNFQEKEKEKEPPKDAMRLGNAPAPRPVAAPRPGVNVSRPPLRPRQDLQEYSDSDDDDSENDDDDDDEEEEDSEEDEIDLNASGGWKRPARGGAEGANRAGLNRRSQKGNEKEGAKTELKKSGGSRRERKERGKNKTTSADGAEKESKELQDQAGKVWARRRKRALTPAQPARVLDVVVLPPYPNPNDENFGVAVKPADSKRYTRCRVCCLYKVQVPSKKEHVCRDDLIGHTWESCPTKNKRSHMKDVVETMPPKEGIKRGDPIVLRKSPLTTQRLQQCRGKMSWFNLQRRRNVISEDTTEGQPSADNNKSNNGS